MSQALFCTLNGMVFGGGSIGVPIKNGWGRVLMAVGMGRWGHRNKK